MPLASFSFFLGEKKTSLLISAHEARYAETFEIYFFTLAPLIKAQTYLCWEA